MVASLLTATIGLNNKELFVMKRKNKLVKQKLKEGLKINLIVESQKKILDIAII